MSAPPRRRDLEKALAELPETLIGEIIFGELVTQPRPAWKHARAATWLDRILGDAFDRRTGAPGGWIITYEPELALGRNVLVPELAGWRAEELPEDLDVARIDIAPDWVCEVLSPSTKGYDRDDKARIYAATGVGHLWLVDPVARTVEAKRNERGLWIDLGTYQHGDVAHIEPFDALELELARVFAR